MPEPIAVSTTEFRKNLATYLQAASEGQVVWVLSHGYRIAALVGRADAEAAEQINAKR